MTRKELQDSLDYHRQYMTANESPAIVGNHLIDIGKLLTILPDILAAELPEAPT